MKELVENVMIESKGCSRVEESGEQCQDGNDGSEGDL